MFVNRCYENETPNAMGQNDGNCMNMNMNMNCAPQSCGQVVMECPCERVCHTETVVNVPHVVPINTRVINHRIYRHTYQPMYTCTMEEEVCNVYDNNCGF